MPSNSYKLHQLKKQRARQLHQQKQQLNLKMNIQRQQRKKSNHNNNRSMNSDGNNLCLNNLDYGEDDDVDDGSNGSSSMDYPDECRKFFSYIKNF